MSIRHLQMACPSPGCYRAHKFEIVCVMEQASFIRSRAEQLADHIRGCIARGEVLRPIPNTRDWSSQLGVSRDTLKGAIKILKRKGLLRVRPRKGIELAHTPVLAKGWQRSRAVRWLYYGRDYPDASALVEIRAAISERLEPQGIRLTFERCDAARMRAIHRRGEHPGEMFLLGAVPDQFLGLFSTFKKSVLVIRPRLSGFQMPFISIEILSALRHATHMLVRRGFFRISLIVKEGSLRSTARLFQRICVEASRSLRGDVVRIPVGLCEQNLAVQRFAASIKGRHGLIALYPVPAGLLMTALMKRGLDVPEQVEVVAMNTTLQAIRLVPMPVYYPFPVEKFAKVICQAAVHYFEQGALPPIRKRIPIEMVAQTVPSRKPPVSVGEK